MRTIFPESETRGIANFDFRSTLVTVDGRQVRLWVLPSPASPNEIRAASGKHPGLLVLLRGAGYRKAVPPELAPESVLDVHKVEDLQAALFEASHKLGRLYDGDHYGALAGAGGLELAFSTRLAPDEALLLMAATANVRSLQAYLDGTSWQDPRWI